MTVEIRALRDDEHEAMVLNDMRAFSASEPVAPMLARLDTELELDRFVVAVDDSELVGNAGAFSLELTLPGGASVGAGAVTWVAVAGTHRRRGIMRGMLDRLADDARSRSEVVAVLWAAEASIYENLGYGAAARACETVIHPRRVRFRDDAPAGGSVRFLEPSRVPDVLPQVHDRARRRRPGDVGRNDRYWVKRLAAHTHPEDGTAAPFTLVHYDDGGEADGYAVYTSEDRWDVDANHLVTVVDLAATDDVAATELWRMLCSLDLVGEIRTDQLAPDDPLSWMVGDPRAVAIDRVFDSLWLKVLDVAGVFGARSYGTDDDLVVDAGALGRWHLGAAGVKETDDPADVSMTDVELGAISLGGASVTTLVRAGRITEHSPGTAGRLGALLASDPQPYLTTHF